MAEWDGRALPAVAAARLERAKRSGVATSLLGVPGHLGVTAAGFSPVGEVMGCLVAHLGFAGYGGCGWTYGFAPPQATVTSSSSSRYFAFGPYVDAKRSAWGSAIERMLTEASALGADGVVAVRLEENDLGQGAREFVALGTAVRSTGARHSPRPFATTLSGQDLAKLVARGYLPAAIVVALSVGIRHDDYRTIQATFLTAGNIEVPGYSDLVASVRHDARHDLERQLRALGASGAILTSPMSLRIFEIEPSEGHRDHVAEAHVVASALVGEFAPTGPAPLAILSLK